MSVVLFVAVVSGDAASGYTATFPDLDGLAASGADLTQLLVTAREVLAAGLAAIANSGEAWPAPTPIEAVVVPRGTLAIPIDVAVEDPPIRVNVSLGEHLVQRIDAAAQLRGMTRSGFIAQAVRVSLGETAPRAGEYDAVGRRVQEEILALGRRLTDSLGPDSSFSKRMNALDDVVYEGVRKAADSLSAAIARRTAAARPQADGGAPEAEPN